MAKEIQSHIYNFIENGVKKHYTVEFKFFSGSLGTLEDPPTDDEVEICSIKDEYLNEVQVDDNDELLLKIERDILKSGGYDHYYDEFIE